ncbi:MAG: V-type ATP synthase subunit E [Methanomicrobiales archaeon]|jgi:V/A-type H+-transporting ATPase subunit E|nr:V-type ATP synthase subunit E [Methanomicrobiales archaeon]
MGLDAVIAEIKEKARVEANAIVEEAEAKKTEILAAAQTQAQLIKTATEENAQKSASHIHTQEEAAGHLAVKREVLNAQKALMDEVQKKTLKQIYDLPESFHKQAITSLLKRARLEIPSGTVTCAARDVEALKSVLSDSELKSFTIGEPIEIDGGIIVESTDGMLQVDYSYRTFLNQVWESGLKDASDALFH